MPVAKKRVHKNSNTMALGKEKNERGRKREK
jgi:hypothetical protein